MIMGSKNEVRLVGWREVLEPRIVELRLTWHLIKKNPLTVTGIIVLAFVVLASILAPLISPHDPIEQDLSKTLLPPSREHVLGTDYMGRDVLSRIIWGGRYSITIGVIVTVVSAVIGVLIGLVSGYLGGKTDEIVMRVSDIFLAFPSLVLAMAIAAALGPGLMNTMTAMIAVWWPGYARLVRGSVLSTKEQEFVEAARAVGEGNARIIFRHILPNCLAPIIVAMTLDVGYALIYGSGLSFIGLGAQPPTPEWGVMVSEGRHYIMNQWWVSTFPGIAILITVVSICLFGDGLRDALDPRMRR